MEPPSLDLVLKYTRCTAACISALLHHEALGSRSCRSVHRRSRALLHVRLRRTPSAAPRHKCGDTNQPP